MAERRIRSKRIKSELGQYKIDGEKVNEEIIEKVLAKNKDRASLVGYIDALCKIYDEPRDSKNCTFLLYLLDRELELRQACYERITKLRGEKRKREKEKRVIDHENNPLVVRYQIWEKEQDRKGKMASPERFWDEIMREEDGGKCYGGYSDVYLISKETFKNWVYEKRKKDKNFQMLGNETKEKKPEKKDRKDYPFLMQYDLIWLRRLAFYMSIAYLNNKLDDVLFKYLIGIEEKDEAHRKKEKKMDGMYKKKIPLFRELKGIEICNRICDEICNG